ncbi:AAA family ATPase [Streptomyces sp. NPDC093982]|uniref:helix-turn-helix transcriptional regulator n=1 Tax=Streptomyces sp. NPDC093982 TaxID=3155077 RepID=UPI00342EBE33
MQLVDRVDQLAELEHLARDARGGTSSVVLVEGSPGLGKTALLDEWTAQERLRGMWVLTARCSAAERDLPFGAVRQLFAGTRGEQLATPDSALVPPALFDVFDALHHTIRTLSAERAVLIAVDDLELCDRQSIQWLGYLTRRLTGIRVLVAGTSLPDMATAPAPGRLGVTGLLDHPRCRRVELHALTTEGIELLLEWDNGPLPSDCVQVTHGPPGPLDTCRVDACLPDVFRTITGGNPRLVRELLNVSRQSQTGADSRHLEQLSELVRQQRVQMTHARIRREPAETLALARVAAVLGDGCDPHFVATVAQLDELAAAAGVQGLEHIGALRPSAPGMTFADATLRVALEGEVAPDKRSALRLCAAQLSHDVGAGNEQVAGHLLGIARSVPEPWVIPALRAAAGDALRRGAPEDATAYLRCALRQPVAGTAREQLLTELGRVLLYRDPAVACRYLSEAIATIEDPVRRGRVASLLSTAHLLCGRLGAAMDVLVETRASLRSTIAAAEAPKSTLAAWTEIDARLQVHCTLARATGAPHRTPITPGTPTDAAPKSAAGRGVWRLGTMALETALAGHSASRTRALAMQAFRSGLVVREGCSELSFFVALSLLYTDDLDAAERAFSEIGTGAERSGARILQAAATFGRSMVHQGRGEIREALGMAATAVDELFELPPGCFRGSVAAHMITLLLDNGRLDAAESLVRQAVGHGGDGDMDSWDSAVLNLAIGRLRAASGDIPGALIQVLDCGRRLDLHGVANPAMLTWRSDAAILHSLLGEQEQACHLAREELQLAERWGTSRAMGRALWVLGVATGGEEGRRMLATAVAHQEAVGAQLELVRTLIDYGVSESAAGGLVRGRAHLRRAVELAHRCGAARLVERASVALANTGARPRSSGSDRWSSLTPGELQVARLAASGARNREIAAKLHVTARAVERHLTSAYRKLGVAGRPELGELLGRQ